MWIRSGLQHLWAELAKRQQGGDIGSLSRSMPCKRKCFRSRCPGVAASYESPKDGMFILEDLPSNISGSMNKKVVGQKMSTLGLLGRTDTPLSNPAISAFMLKLLCLSWRLQQPPSVAWNAKRVVQCPTTTNSVANARHQHLRSGGAESNRSFFFAIEGYSWWSFLYISTIIFIPWYYIIYLLSISICICIQKFPTFKWVFGCFW